MSGEEKRHANWRPRSRQRWRYHLASGSSSSKKGWGVGRSMASLIAVEAF
jgi:hypothetical protein